MTEEETGLTLTEEETGLKKVFSLQDDLSSARKDDDSQNWPKSESNTSSAIASMMKEDDSFGKRQHNGSILLHVTRENPSVSTYEKY